MPEQNTAPTATTVARLMQVARGAAILGDIGRQQTIAEVQRRLHDRELSNDSAWELVRYGWYDALPHREDVWYGGPVPLAYLDSVINPDNVPCGYYAVDTTTGEGTRFYRVEQPGMPKCKKPWPLIRRYSGSNSGPLPQDEAEHAVSAIAADPATAAWLFSDLSRRCSLCGTTLTDRVSRLLSIGPDCRGFAATAALTRAASTAMDEQTGRLAYRALAEAFGYRPDRRSADAGATAAAALLSVWLDAGLDPADLPAIATQAASGSGTTDPRWPLAVTAASLDSAKLLLKGRSRIVPAVVEALMEHPDSRIADLATETFMDALAGNR